MKLLGIFYKSQGTWTGPLWNSVYSDQQFKTLKKSGTFQDIKKTLKSKISVRKVQCKHVQKGGWRYLLTYKGGK